MFRSGVWFIYGEISHPKIHHEHISNACVIFNNFYNIVTYRSLYKTLVIFLASMTAVGKVCSVNENRIKEKKQLIKHIDQYNVKIVIRSHFGIGNSIVYNDSAWEALLNDLDSERKSTTLHDNIFMLLFHYTPSFIDPVTLSILALQIVLIWRPLGFYSSDLVTYIIFLTQYVIIFQWNEGFINLS